MSALEEQIMARVRQLDTRQQAQVLAFLTTLDEVSEEPHPFDYAAWWQRVDALHAAILAEHGPDYRIDVQALLDEVREEASWPF